MNRKFLPLVFLAFILFACAPATSAPTPTKTPSPKPSATATQTNTPPPTLTPTPATDILYEELITCAGFEILCSNPHAFGLEGAALESWRAKRAEVDAMYETAWGQVLAENAAEGKWQAEFQTFFGRSAPDVNNWNNLSNQDQMDMVAAWLRIYNDGVTAVNVPSGWINEAVSNRDLETISKPFERI
jgi:hypothetical protein